VIDAEKLLTAKDAKTNRLIPFNNLADTSRALRIFFANFAVKRFNSGR